MATRAKSKVTPELLQNSYVSYVLTEGKTPASVFAFAQMIGISEGEFYKLYTSFEAIEESIWTGLMADSLSGIKADENFAEFSAREKLLAFFYTHLEVLRERRSFVVMKWPEVKRSLRVPKALEAYKKHFMDFAKEIVNEAIEKDEIKYRAMISERYDQAFWFQLAFIVDYWCGDTSKGFEQSDAAVEKAVNLAFQLLGETALDGAIDFAKFLWQKNK